MVLLSQKASVPINGKITKRRKIFLSLLLAIVCLIVPVLIIIIDPIHKIVNYNLRLATGSALYNLLKVELKGARLAIYAFNITNPDRFMSGEDRKLKLKEVGPFVYQEYRWNEDMKESEDGTEMAMTSRFSPEFLREDSIADLKDINLTLPNLPLLSATAMLSTYPSFIKFMFTGLASQMNSQVIMNLDMHSYMWGYKNPIITLCHKLIPGLIYFDSIGLLDRLYDKEADYRLIVGATTKDRFKIKSVKKYRHLREGGIDDVGVSELKFQDTYEGIGYPPELTPDVPINWYRVPVCRTLGLEYQRSQTMEYGGEGLVYTLSNKSFINEQNPVTKERYPDGLMDISGCYYGMPFVGSNSHFVDGDPKLLDSVEGLVPNKKKFYNRIILDRRAAVTFHTKLSLQLNLVINDISYYERTRRFSNITLPVLRVDMEQPRMSKNMMFLFYLVYKILPWFLIVVEIILIFTSLLLISYALRSMYRNWSISSGRLIFQTAIQKKILTETQSNVPLITNQTKA